MTRNLSLKFAEVPENLPVAGQHLQVTPQDTFDLEAKPPQYGFLGKVLYASFDPYLRNRFVSPEKARDGFEPLPVGSTVPNGIIIEVMRSNRPELRPGDHVLGMGPIQEYVKVDSDQAELFIKLGNQSDISLSFYLGCLGMPGLTAYAALYEIGKPKKGETIFISAASGAVGQIVGQLAKREGLTVLGSVGSDKKLNLLTDVFGFDGGFNYRKGDIRHHLEQLAPGGIDIYFDNVGGEQLESAITKLRDFGRIVACGYASQYSIPPEQQFGIRTTSQIIGKRVTWRGFSVFDEEVVGKYRAEHQRQVSEWIKDGSFIAVESVTLGIENAATGLLELIQGQNVGKAILKL